jgi:hypothetical protein
MQGDAGKNIFTDVLPAIVLTIFYHMKKTVLILTAALPVLLSSCATSRPPQAYQNTDNSALIVESLDAKTCQIIAPVAMVTREDSGRVLEQAKSFAQHQTAVVILENYSEPKLGPEFRDRTFSWFLGLRGLGYQRIVFLQGRGVNDPNGLPTLAEYD